MEPKITRKLEHELIAGVVTAAVWSEEMRPGLWRDMLGALNRGAAGSKDGTVNEFLFQAMVDRLLAEFHRET